MKKKEFVIFHFDFVDIFEIRLYFCFGNDVSKAIKFAKKHGYDFTDEEFGGKRGMFVNLKDCAPIIFCSEVPRTPTQHGTVLHEIYHFVDWVCRYWSTPLSKDTEEMRAQLFSNTARRYFEKIKRLK